MKTQHAIKQVAFAAGLLLALTPIGAYAAGTAAGAPVTNSVTLDFSVGGTSQAQQTGSATFTVDNKMVLTVTNSDGADVTANPNAGSGANPKAVLTFSVQNDGNGTVDAILSAVSMATGTANPNGGTPTNSDQTVSAAGVYSDAACTAPITSIANLAAGTSQTVYVCSDIPGSATNDQVAVVGLLANAGVAGSGVAYDSAPAAGNQDDSGTDKNANLNTEYNIFAEAASGTPATGDAGANDGAASDLGAYRIQAASLTLTKVVKVLNDPTGMDVTNAAPNNTPHAIPGAKVEYTVTVTNAAGVQSATSIDIKDVLDGNTTYVASSMTVNGTACTDSGAGSTIDLDAGPGTNNATCNNAAPNLEVSGFTVGAGETVTITYQATIN